MRRPRRLQLPEPSSSGPRGSAILRRPSRVVVIVARIVSGVCVLILLSLLVFDAQAERFTAGLTPYQFRQELEGDLRKEYPDVLGVAHNAGDDVGATFEAAAYGVDAIEIDVTSVGGGLHASHDAPIPLLDTLFFRGPELDEAWEAARVRDTILLHLKESSPGYLAKVRDFLAERRDRAVIFQTRDAASLRMLARTVPWARRLKLIFSRKELDALRGDPELRATIDGVSVRDRLLTPADLQWLEREGLATFAWTVNDVARMNELVERGLDGLITDRLDIMALLGGRPQIVR